ncbi:MAG TPA: hypothetical protein VLJ14_02470 [Ktedonobacterales bacterium]|nr:hypothetical protein [Ktedonobacterales bacterium]
MSIQPIGHHKRLPAYALLAALFLMLTLSACATSAPSISTPRSDATHIASATATRSAEAARTATPVQVDVSSTQRGHAATGDVHLIVAVTVTNRTVSPIALLIPMCHSPNPIQLALLDVLGRLTWYAPQDTTACILDDTLTDLSPTLPAGAAHTWIYDADLSATASAAGSPAIPGARYTLLATVAEWHQGTANQAQHNPGIPHGSAVGQTTVLIQ